MLRKKSGRDRSVGSTSNKDSQKSNGATLLVAGQQQPRNKGDPPDYAKGEKSLVGWSIHREASGEWRWMPEPVGCGDVVL